MVQPTLIVLWSIPSPEEAVRGTLRRHRAAHHPDACIAAHSASRKTDAPVLCALRLGIYQILYMDSIPHSAAVDERQTAKAAQNPGIRLCHCSALCGRLFLPEHPLSARLSVEFSCPSLW